MTTVANSANSYSKRMEIIQMGSNKSNCVLLSEFLKKAENYTLQIERFVVNIAPQINSVTEPYFEIFARPDENIANLRTVADMAAASAALPHRVFSPINPKSIIDVAIALKDFCSLHIGLDVVIDSNYELGIIMDGAFGASKYLKINPVIARLLQLPQYIYHFLDNDGVTRLGNDRLTDTPDLFYTTAELAAAPHNLAPANVAANTFFRIHNAAIIADDEQFQTGPITKLDTRLSLDVVSTIGTDSKIVVLNQQERRRKLIGRFAIGDNHDVFADNNNEITEVINVGLEDLTRGNPDTQTLNLHPGDVYVVNTAIEIRYLEDGEIKIKDANFEQSGFFYLQLLFSKRLK